MGNSDKWLLADEGFLTLIYSVPKPSLLTSTPGLMVIDMVNYLDFNDGILVLISQSSIPLNFRKIQYVEVDALKTWEGAFDGDVEKELIDDTPSITSMNEIDEIVL